MKWFDDVPVLAAMTDEEVAARLAVYELDVPHEGAVRGWFDKAAYRHSQHLFGYVPLGEAGSSEPILLQNAGMVIPDRTLLGAQVTVTLDRMMIKQYPGWGGRTILFDFYAQNHVQGQVEHLHFNQTYRAQQGQLIGVMGFPIFVGLTVGEAGLVFKCFTVNVKNDADEKFLKFLDSPQFQTGLKLAKTAQPAIVPFSDTAINMTKQIAGRNRNVGVQEFYLGLDFSDVATRAKLCEGSYVAVQTDEVIDWNNWRYYPTTGRIGHCDNATQLLDYNYIVFSVSRNGSSTAVPPSPSAPTTVAEPARTSSSTKTTKRALLIGINKYPNLGPRYQLGGCVNDVAVLGDLLETQFGFPAENVTRLTDEIATRSIILATLDQLIADTQTDDIVVIHYSGHGSQMTDREGDEADGLDETIMPHDSGRGTHENRDITDDELNMRLVALGKKTPFVTLIFDCCHSGTISRDPTMTAVRHVPADTRPIDQLPPSPITAAQPAQLPKIRSASPWLPNDQNYVLLSACRDDEFAHEHRGNGALTYFLTRVLADVPASLTARSLFETVRHQVTARYRYQHPQIEGAADRLLFGTAAITPERYITVGKQNGRRVVLEAGELQQVTVRSVYAIYLAGTTAPNQQSPLAHATIERVDTVTAEAALDADVRLPAGCRAFATQHVYPPFVLTIRYDIPQSLQNDTYVQQLYTHVQDSPLWQTVAQGEADVVVRLGAGIWQLFGRDGYLCLPQSEASNVETVLENLDKYARFQHVLTLENTAVPNPLRGHVSMTLLVKQDGEFRPLAAGQSVQDGTLLTVEVKNLYTQTIYISLINLGLSGGINVLPDQASQAITPGQKLSIPLRMQIPEGFPFAPPPEGIVVDSGLEMFKLFVTLDQADFRPLLQGRYRDLPADRHPLAGLFSTALAGTRDAYTLDTVAAVWDVLTHSFPLCR